MSGPTYDNCLFAARRVMAALEEIGETCCLVGGMAVRLNGKKDRVIKVGLLPRDKTLRNEIYVRKHRNID
jgi:hypothetical protein